MTSADGCTMTYMSFMKLAQLAQNNAVNAGAVYPASVVAIAQMLEIMQGALPVIVLVLSVIYTSYIVAIKRTELKLKKMEVEAKEKQDKSNT